MEHILRLLEADSARDRWWMYLRTCRQWHRIGLGLYKGLGFAATAIVESDTRRCNVDEEALPDDYPLYIDFDFTPPSELYLSRLRSLTIHVRHQRTATPFRPKPGADLVTTLQSSFRSMAGLTTFSLKYSEGWEFPDLEVPMISQSRLARLVAAIPHTVVDLELDTAGTDLPPDPELVAHDKGKHLCYQISVILNRLRHLRLRIGHICSDLLGFRPNTPPCSHAPTCDYCSASEAATCLLLRTWKMRTMTIWLPWGQAQETNSFALAATTLLNPSLYNPTTILLIQQTDHMHPDRSSITKPPSNIYNSFTWTPISNVSHAIRSRLDAFAFKPISGHCTTLRAPAPSSAQTLAQTIAHSTPLRRFQLSGTPAPQRTIEAGSTTAYPFLALHALEASLAWTQRHHASARFPLSESDQPGKTYWKPGDVGGAEKRFWYCEFPGCRERRGLIGLRGHVMYAHAEQAWRDGGVGRWACVSVGCDRVGERGFGREEELEAHLRGHWRRGWGGEGET